MPDSEKFVIVGASHAGAQLAMSLRENGFTGTITLVSEEAHMPYHRPPLSKAYLKDGDPEIQPLRGETCYDDNNIELIKSRKVVNIEANRNCVELDNGEVLPYSGLCLATGAEPRALNISGISAKGVYQLRNANDAKRLHGAARLHKRVVIIGGGFIGLETAATLRAIGLEVNVIEASSQLMGKAVAPEIAEFVQRKLCSLGIDIFLEASVEKIQTKNGVVDRVVCGELNFSVDMVLIGVGVVPNDELAKKAGLKVSDGIQVDENMRTSIGNIFAIGDVASYQNWLTGSEMRLESVQNATDQARNLAQNIVGRVKPYRAVPWFWSDQADMKIQMAGLNHNACMRVIRDNQEKNSLSVFHFDMNRKLVAIDTINAPADHMAGRKLIEKGLSPTPEQAKDVNFSLKRLLL